MVGGEGRKMPSWGNGAIIIEGGLPVFWCQRSSDRFFSFFPLGRRRASEGLESGQGSY